MEKCEEKYKGKVFSEKIKYINEKICSKKGANELVKLFYSEDDGITIENRKKQIVRWLNGEISKSPTLLIPNKYEEFKIFTDYQIDSKPLFTLYMMLDATIIKFKTTVDKYVEVELKKDNPSQSEYIGYKYIYMYNSYKKKIIYYTITNMSVTSNSELKITLIPPDSIYAVAKKYKGVFEIKKNQIFISVHNSFENMAFSFVSKKIGKKDQNLFGIGVGIDNKTFLPISKKAIMTKLKLSAKEKSEHLLSLNVVEVLTTDKSSYYDNTISHGYNKYLERYFNKIKNCNSLIDKALKVFTNMHKDFYLKILIREFKSFQELFTSVMNNNNLKIVDNQSAITVFLESIPKSNQKCCYIVRPITDSDKRPSIKRDEVIDKSIALVNDGIEINRIFIVDCQKDINDILKNKIDKMLNAGINVKLAKKSDIQTLVAKDYFAYSKDGDIALYRTRNNKHCFVQVTKQIDIIETIQEDYAQIEYFSKSVKEFMQL